MMHGPPKSHNSTSTDIQYIFGIKYHGGRQLGKKSLKRLVGEGDKDKKELRYTVLKILSQ